MYPYQSPYLYRSPYPVADQRLFGLGWPLAIGGLGFLGGLIGGGLAGAAVSRPFYGYPGFGYGYPGMYPPPFYY